MSKTWLLLVSNIALKKVFSILTLRFTLETNCIFTFPQFVPNIFEQNTFCPKAGSATT
jgi:hypothetical protein